MDIGGAGYPLRADVGHTALDTLHWQPAQMQQGVVCGGRAQHAEVGAVLGCELDADVERCVRLLQSNDVLPEAAQPRQPHPSDFCCSCCSS